MKSANVYEGDEIESRIPFKIFSTLTQARTESLGTEKKHNFFLSQ